MYTTADGDIELAQKGIVYIDEIDKIARAGENRSITRDLSGQGVQESLLKLIEGCTISVPMSDRRKHPQGNNVQFDTSNVLFVVVHLRDYLIQKKRPLLDLIQDNLKQKIMMMQIGN